MSMIRPETEMKDSGIEYVGAIPNDWDLVRLRAYFGERKNKNKDGNETNLLSLSYGRIIRKNIDKTDGLLPASFNTYDWNEIGTSLEFTMKFFYYIMIVSKNIQIAKNT